MKLTRERMIIRRQHQGLVMMIMITEHPHRSLVTITITRHPHRGLDTMIMITEHPHRSLVMMMITDPIEAAVECACGTVEALLALSLDR